MNAIIQMMLLHGGEWTQLNSLTLNVAQYSLITPSYVGSL